MHFSPIMIFVFILAVLAISIIFGNSLKSLYPNNPSRVDEGFITYRYEANSPHKGNVTIPYYSTTRGVDRLYDNMYYDRMNGSVIVVFGEKSSAPTTAVVDNSGTTIENYAIFDRQGTELNRYYKTQGSPATYTHPQSTVADLNTSTKNFCVEIDNLMDKYELIYIPWGKETYIHIIQLIQNTTPVKKHLCTYAYSADRVLVQYNSLNMGVRYIAPPIGTASATGTTTPFIQQSFNISKTNDGNRTLQVVKSYSTTKSVFQLCTNVYYNSANGQLISETNNNKLNVYSRPTALNGGPLIKTKTDIVDPPATITPTTIEDVAGFSAGVADTPDNNLYTVLYISIGRRTILVSLTANDRTDSKNMFLIHNVALFDENQKLYVPPNQATPTNATDNTTAGNTNSSGNNNPYDMSNYYKFLLAMMGTSGDDISSLPITNDYMLRSQIVPPVCPTCPSCPANSGVCTNCGGNGGSGTQTGTGGSGTQTQTSANQEAGNLLVSAGSGATSLARDAGSGAASLARDTASGTVDLAKDTVGGTVDLAKDTVGGTVDLAKDTVGGAVGLVKDTVGGAVGLAKDAGSGIVNTFGRLNPTVVSSSSQAGQSGSGQSAGNGAGTNVTTGSDHTSYFGALPPKGGNYIPVTADFSRFGR